MEKIIKRDKEKESEFAIYNSIVNGELRPFLEIYSSENHIKNLMERLWTVSFLKTEEGFQDASKQDESLLEILVKPGDKLEFEFDETDPQKRPILTIIPSDKLEELVDIDIPPPPDLKAKYFLDLIEIEYKKIRFRANKVLDTSSNKDQIDLFANNNIQKLKEIAGQAHTLYRRIKPKDKRTSPLDDSDSYIITVLKIYLIRSILFYQRLFQPYLKVPIQDEFGLRTYLYGETHPTVVMREWDERKRNELYNNLGVEMNRLKNNGNKKNLEQQIYSLKNLILNENWLKTVAKDAVSNGFIGISHLVFIMASDESYTKNLILTQLIENMLSELHERKDYYFGFKELSISDYKSRIDVWHELIHYWVRGNNEYFRDKYKNYLPLYYFNPTTKDLDRFDHKKMYDQLIQEKQKKKSDELSIEERIEVSKIMNNIARFVKMSELKKYMADVLKIPLPSALFPDNALFNLDGEKQVIVKKLRPSQKAKKECRKIAKKIWEKNPQITIADMINHEDLLPHTTKKDGIFYTEKTVRNWIKDLCPDRTRGRRKST